MLENTNMNNEIEKIIIEKAKSLGFSLVSFTDIDLSKEQISAYKKWLEKGLNADLHYMENFGPRENMEKILNNAKTVICLATNYNTPKTVLKKGELKIGKYAYGRDYHKFIKTRLKKLEEFLKQLFPNISTRSFVDACPILERAYARKSGIGFVGKNSCLITKEFGSFVFLSEIICDIKFRSSCKKNHHLEKNFSTCGSCTLCIDSCPTKAIIASGVVDASKCIAYHTIENKGETSPSILKVIKEQKILFACDICQEVCPHNYSKPYTKDAEILKKIAGSTISVSELKTIKTEEEFLAKFKGSPLMRAKLRGLKKIIDLY